MGDEDWIKEYNFKYPTSLSSNVHNNDDLWIYFSFNNMRHKLTDSEFKQYALSHRNIKGKWMLFISVSDIDKFWLLACKSYVDKKLDGVISMKVATLKENPRASNANQKVIMFYTCDPFNEEYITNIAVNIIDSLNLTGDECFQLTYKLNEQTERGTKATGQKNCSIYRLTIKDKIFARTKGYYDFVEN